MVPNGLLVFFPSYSLLQKCLNCWKASEADIYNRIAAHKPILVEPRAKGEFQQTMEEYERKVSDPALSGAIFMGVARGKVSEGLDFADHFGRAVIITGLPYAPFMDPRVKLKMEYLDEARVQATEGLTGRAWYRQDAWRAINQAIGRVIRHRNDYGAVLLCDERFASADARAQLPEWMRADMRTFAQFGACVRELSLFFKASAEDFPAPALKAPAGRTPAEGRTKAAEARPRTHPLLASSAPQRSADRECLAPSLRVAHPNSLETVQMSKPAAAASPAGASSGLLSLLDRHDRHLEGLSGGSSGLKRRSLSLLDSQGSVDPLERRLEKLQKRRKLVVKAQPSLLVPGGGQADSRAYLERVKAAFEHDPASLRSFNECLQAYKRESDLEALKGRLLQLFVFADAPQLARDFVVFVRSEHRTAFATFCTEQLGMQPGEDKEGEREAAQEKENEGSA